ncbi:hypothetical protein AHAT_20650 [Agarivorans sp. Toyoura001]|uniref:fibrinogen-like YCDxxxxGGGW domain-containing protein n=1 Tax=Agarivorans sp. Toyoura001 TaxID=2283141 RepID=UPI0010E874C7|nr:fibrinogen-like YCDxxxxGGGW domain-containing protein [Agarivorans sp. Toyoura001]GDY26175.1 hypothetical protein AHAT_20650 [Agarivorans sp. Toyoura001]
MRTKISVTIAILFANYTSATNLDSTMTLSLDSLLDGVVVETSSFELNLTQNNSSIISTLNKDQILKGSINDGRVISFAIEGMQQTSYFLGLKNEARGYSGTWYSLEGAKGDWDLLSPSITEIKRDCSEIYDAGESTGDGYYQIDPDGENFGIEAFEVYCDMTTQGGGWTLFAHHKDAIPQNIEGNPVSPNEYSVLSDERWKALRENINVGIMLIDELNKITHVSKDTMSPTNPNNVFHPWVVDSLSTDNYNTNYGGLMIWCNTTYSIRCTNGSNISTHPSMIQLAGQNYTGYGIAGAAVYDGENQIDSWPYPTHYSYSQQNELLYYLK